MYILTNSARRYTARNFNPPVATAGKICIAEVEEIVEAGSLHPDEIHLPGIYVNRLIKGTGYEKRIEVRTTAHALPHAHHCTASVSLVHCRN